MGSIVIPFRGLPVEILRPLAESWSSTARGSELGIETDPNSLLADLAQLGADQDSMLWVLLEGKPIGFMGIRFFKSPVGNELVASEKYWYILPEARGRSGLKLIRQARAYAKQMGAAYMLFSASTLASDLHDKVCTLYEHMGMKKFETTYLDMLKGD